jgi:hypothetical protein
VYTALKPTTVAATAPRAGAYARRSNSWRRTINEEEIVQAAAADAQRLLEVLLDDARRHLGRADAALARRDHDTLARELGASRDLILTTLNLLTRRSDA